MTGGPCRWLTILLAAAAWLLLAASIVQRARGGP